MALAISSSHTSREIWASLENDKQVLELTIINCQISESTIQKIQSISPQRLIFVNTQITKTLLEPLIELRLKNLTCIDCTLKDADAEVLAFSGAQEKVVFKRCILTHLPLSNKSDKETISLGIMKTAEEVAVFNPDLTDLAEKFSEISKDFLENIDFPDQNLQIEEVDFVLLIAEQMKLSILLCQATRTFIRKNMRIFAELWIHSSVDCPLDFIKEMEKKADAVEKIMKQINESAYEKAKDGADRSQEKSKSLLNLLTNAHAELEAAIRKDKQKCSELFSANNMSI